MGLAPGVWRAEVLRHPVFLVSVQDIPVERDSLPFHVLAGVPEKDVSTVANLLRSEEKLWPRFGAWLAVYDPATWQEIQSMSRAKLAEEGKLDYGPLIDYLRQSGDTKRPLSAGSGSSRCSGMPGRGRRRSAAASSLPSSPTPASASPVSSPKL